MAFPKHPLRKFPEESNKAVENLQPKLIGFTPISFCDFFENFNVIQTYSEKHHEYIQGIYFNDQLIGHVYLGSKYTQLEIAKHVDRIMPKTYSEAIVCTDVNAHISYYKYDQSRYAFVYENIIKKVHD